MSPLEHHIKGKTYMYLIGLFYEFVKYSTSSTRSTACNYIYISLDVREVNITQEYVVFECKQKPSLHIKVKPTAALYSKGGYSKHIKLAQGAIFRMA